MKTKLPTTERHTDNKKKTYMQISTLSGLLCRQAWYSTLLLGGGLFVLLSVWMLVGDTAAPRLPWGMPGILPPGDTCIAASWAAYNCCKNKQTKKTHTRKRDKRKRRGEKKRKKKKNTSINKSPKTSPTVDHTLSF